MNQPKVGSILIAKETNQEEKLTKGKEYIGTALIGNGVAIFCDNGKQVIFSLIEIDKFYWGNFFELKSELKETEPKIDWKQLRNEFFNDLTTAYTDLPTIKRMDATPHNVFEWFKNKIENGK